jgi:hypothetical protein
VPLLVWVWARAGADLGPILGVEARDPLRGRRSENVSSCVLGMLSFSRCDWRGGNLECVCCKGEGGEASSMRTGDSTPRPGDYRAPFRCGRPLRACR